jgi:hypothetical protein
VDEDGCPAQGAKLFWPTSCVGFALNDRGTQHLDPTATFETIRKAFKNWTEVPCPGGGNASFTFEDRGTVSCRTSEYNKSGPNLNIIFFQDDDWHYRGIDGTLAKTSVTYNDETGEIYDADIEVNAAYNEITIGSAPQKVEYDLLSIMTHEIGHFVGIAHSGKPGSVMSKTYSPGTTEMRQLSADDVNAICAIYPPNSGVKCNSEPRGGFVATCGESEAKSWPCDVAAGATSTRGIAPTTVFATAGFFIVALFRRARRATRLGRRS